MWAEVSIMVKQAGDRDAFKQHGLVFGVITVKTINTELWGDTAQLSDWVVHRQEWPQSHCECFRKWTRVCRLNLIGLLNCFQRQFLFLEDLNRT